MERKTIEVLHFFNFDVIQISEHKSSICLSFLFNYYNKHKPYVCAGNGRQITLNKHTPLEKRKRLGFKNQAKRFYGKGYLRDKVVNFKHNKEVFDINYMKQFGQVIVIKPDGE